MKTQAGLGFFSPVRYAAAPGHRPKARQGGNPAA